MQERSPLKRNTEAMGRITGTQKHIKVGQRRKAKEGSSIDTTMTPYKCRDLMQNRREGIVYK